MNDCDDCKFVCRDCAIVHPRIFMVHDAVWVGEAGLPKQKCLLCLECFEKILGRKLIEDDFTDAPCNWWPIMGEPLLRWPPSTEPKQ